MYRGGRTILVGSFFGYHLERVKLWRLRKVRWSRWVRGGLGSLLTRANCSCRSPGGKYLTTTWWWRGLIIIYTLGWIVYTVLILPVIGTEISIHPIPIHLWIGVCIQNHSTVIWPRQTPQFESICTTWKLGFSYSTVISNCSDCDWKYK